MSSVKTSKDLRFDLGEGIYLDPIPLRTKRDLVPKFQKRSWSVSEEWYCLPSEKDVAALSQCGIQSLMIPYAKDIPDWIAGRNEFSLRISQTDISKVDLKTLEKFQFVKIIDRNVGWASSPPFSKWICVEADHLQSPFGQLKEVTSQLLQILTDLDEKQKLAFPKIRVYTKVGHRYLTEIGKLRACRLLINNIWNAFGLDQRVIPGIHCLMEYDEHLDEYNNLIGHTVKTMAGINGGADVLCFGLPQALPPQSEFVRLSRNIPQILKNESQWTHPFDALMGSHVIEAIRDKLATEVWKEIGGMAS